MKTQARDGRADAVKAQGPGPQNATSGTRGGSLALTIGALVFVALVAGLVAYRLQLGISLSDESFYTAVPYRFVLGDRPFVDEMNVVQTFAFLTYPLVRLFVAITGGTAGIVLFMRVAYLALMVLTGLAVFGYARRHIRWQLALLASALPLTFAPWNIQSLSYNTMGGALLTIGLFLVLRGVDTQPSPRWLVAGGVALGLAVVSYATMLVPAVFVNVTLFLHLGRGQRRKVLWYLLGAAVVLVPFVAYLAHVGAHDLLAAYRVTRAGSAGGGGVSKLGALAQGLSRTVLADPLLVVVFVALGVTHARHSATMARVRLAVLLLIPLAVIPLAAYPGPARTSGVLLCLSLIGLALLLFAREAVGSGEFALVFLPSLLAGGIAGYTSNNGYLNAAVGLLPAAIITLVWLCREVGVEVRGAADVPAGAGRLAAVVPLVGVLVLMVGLQYRAFYSDANLRSLTQRIALGPFAGIKTSPENAALTTDIQRDVLRLTRPDDRILFFDLLPAGYLMTGLKPVTNLAWMPSPFYVPGADRSALLRYYEEQDLLPSIAVQLTRNMPYATDDPVVGFLNSHGRLVLVDDRYSIYRIP